MEPNDDDEDFWADGSSDGEADAAAHSHPPSDDEWDDQEDVEAAQGNGPPLKEHSFLDDQLLFELEAAPMRHDAAAPSWSSPTR